MTEKGYDEELIKCVEKAAAKGARRGSLRFGVLSVIIVPIAVIGCIFLVKSSIEKKWNSFAQDFKEQFTFADPADSHDLVIENKGVLGYTAADFADAVLGDTSKLKKVEVYEARISDAVTLIDTGLANLSIFTKTQVITYNGTAIYTVDLSLLSKDDIEIDEDNKTVIMHIPHAVCGTINTPSNEMEFEDLERGWLAFGEIKLTQEESAKVEDEARLRMEKKLDELNEQEKADRFSKMTFWEMYQPIISSVSPEYKLEIVFTDLKYQLEKMKND